MSAPIPPTQVDQLLAFVDRIDWLVDALRTVAAVAPQAWIGAGAVRNGVWDLLHDRVPSQPDDVDVLVHAADDPRIATRLAYQLDRIQPEINWEVVNQATVHQWQALQLSRPMAAFESVEAAMRTWPETATAVAVRCAAHGRLEHLAPFGLDDLLNLIARPNPSCPDVEAFARRVHDKRFQERWPKLKVIRDRPGDTTISRP